MAAKRTTTSRRTTPAPTRQSTAKDSRARRTTSTNSNRLRSAPRVPAAEPSESEPAKARLAERERLRQAEGHAQTRRAHAAEVAEDYVEAITDLIEAVGEARVVDLAECLGVTHVTVVRTVARLQRDGLVTTRPYRSIFLTPEGQSLAGNVRRRHEIVLAFLRSLGISDSAARADTEGIEHHVSDETLLALERAIAQKDNRRR